MDQVDRMSDAELRASLLKHGYNVPVTASNRNVLKKKLRSILAKNTDRPLQYNVVSDEPAVQPIKRNVTKNTTDFKTYYQISCMSDEELHAKLLEHGYNVRVTASNRSILKMKLENLLTNNDQSGYRTRSIEPVATVRPTKPLVRNSTDFFTASHIPSLTNAELRAKLNQLGYRNMPITATTRPVLERKLVALLNNEPGPSKPVNREIQNISPQTESEIESSSSSDSEVEANSIISGLNFLPNNLILSRHGSTNVCDNPNRVTIPNITSESIRNRERSNTDSTESHNGFLSVSTDISTTTSNVPKESLPPQLSEILHPFNNIFLSSESTNSTQKPSIFSNASHNTISTFQSSDQFIDQEMEDDTLDSMISFIDNFKSRLLALTEEPPKALRYKDRKRNCLTPLQRLVMHSTSKRIRTE